MQRLTTPSGQTNELGECNDGRGFFDTPPATPSQLDQGPTSSSSFDDRSTPFQVDGGLLIAPSSVPLIASTPQANDMGTCHPPNQVPIPTGRSVCVEIDSDDSEMFPTSTLAQPMGYPHSGESLPFIPALTSTPQTPTQPILTFPLGVVASYSSSSASLSTEEMVTHNPFPTQAMSGNSFVLARDSQAAVMTPTSHVEQDWPSPRVMSNQEAFHDSPSTDVDVNIAVPSPNLSRYFDSAIRFRGNSSPSSSSVSSSSSAFHSSFHHPTDTWTCSPVVGYRHNGGNTNNPPMTPNFSSSRNMYSCGRAFAPNCQNGTFIPSIDEERANSIYGKAYRSQAASSTFASRSPSTHALRSPSLQTRSPSLQALRRSSQSTSVAMSEPMQYERGFFRSGIAPLQLSHSSAVQNQSVSQTTASRTILSTLQFDGDRRPEPQQHLHPNSLPLLDQLPFPFSLSMLEALSTDPHVILQDETETKATHSVDHKPIIVLQTSDAEPVKTKINFDVKNVPPFETDLPSYRIDGFPCIFFKLAELAPTLFDELRKLNARNKVRKNMQKQIAVVIRRALKAKAPREIGTDEHPVFKAQRYLDHAGTEVRGGHHQRHTYFGTEQVVQFVARKILSSPARKRPQSSLPC